MEPERIVMLWIENLRHQKSVSQEVKSAIFHYAMMMRRHQHKKSEHVRTKIRNKLFCWVARLVWLPLPWLPLPWLPLPRLRILARTGTYVLPTQACANKSVMTMNGFRSNSFLFNFCLKKCRTYVKTRCNLGLDKNHWQCCRNPGEWPRLRLSCPFEILWCHISGQSPGLQHHRDLPHA